MSPDWTWRWDAMLEAYAWARAMAECPQDPIHHAEGDVWTHTRMVCEAAMGLADWKNGSDTEKTVLLAAALFHDYSKPECTRHEAGRITSRGHSTRGEIAVRTLLWESGVSPALRERIVSLIRFHQTPFFLIERPDARRLAYTVSQSARCDMLAALAESDARGRVCEDRQRLLDNIELFREFCREHDCYGQPRRFLSDHSRFVYFKREDRDPDYQAWEDTRSEAVLMSGLPGAGKDTYVAAKFPDWPVVSLDKIRRDMKIRPTDNQGPVIAHARELAKGYLRRGERFVWNATNLSRQLREVSTNLFSLYNARVHIVYVEAPAAEVFRRNHEREHAVPAAVIRKMAMRWQVPDLSEAHQVTYHWA